MTIDSDLYYEFPSPFGVHVLKFKAAAAASKDVELVSVPFRGSRSEIRNNRLRIGVSAGFPSPFGVHVLKWRRNPEHGGMRVVSVPFRGSRSEILNRR